MIQRHAFGCVSSGSGAGGARLCHRPPDVGIPAGAAMGGSRAVDSGDGMPRLTMTGGH
jgi:hypothetical protein